MNYSPRALQKYLGSATGQAGARGDAWAAAVIANGGTVSDARLLIVKTFIRAEMLNGIWDRTDDYWSLWAESEIQALTSLKQLRLAVAVNSPTFTIDRGYTFDGVTNYINTGFTPSTHAIAMKGDNLRVAAYERTNNASSTYVLGSFTSVNSQIRLVVRSAGFRILGYFDSDFAQTAGDVLDSRGFTSSQRLGNTYTAYKNGQAKALSAPSSSGVALSSASMAIGSYFQASPAGFHAGEDSFVCVGAALSASQELTQYNNIQAWATAVGANV